MNKTLSELLKEFDEQERYIKDINIGQYNEKGVNIGFIKAVDVIKDFISRAYQAGQAQSLKDFVSELKEHSVKVDNERAVKVSMIERLLIKYTK